MSDAIEVTKFQMRAELVTLTLGGKPLIDLKPIVPEDVFEAGELVLRLDREELRGIVEPGDVLTLTVTKAA